MSWMPNLKLMEELYTRYLSDPKSVDVSWRAFFDGMELGGAFQKVPAPVGDEKAFEIVRAYRLWGHLEADCNPMQKPEKSPLLAFDGHEELVSQMRSIYANRIGFEMGDYEAWLTAKLEPKLEITLTDEEKAMIRKSLLEVTAFENFLNSKYPGQTRFSIEGGETLIPLLKAMLTEEVIVGMAHRGRLAVSAYIAGRPLSEIFGEFENDMKLSEPGRNDVKYHMGYKGKGVELIPNPSHLESVNPVTLGASYAKKNVMPILIHGDAAIAGQGVVYESLQLMKLDKYSVKGAIHVVINNQIGYTTLPAEGRSTRYCTDIAKTFGCPVFHVNAEDPESCVFAAKLAVLMRKELGCDVFIDLLCYRKWGHNEGDEPGFTQPLLYKDIRAKKTIAELYNAGDDTSYKEELKVEFGKASLPPLVPRILETKLLPKVSHESLGKVLAAFSPTGGFNLNPKLLKLFQNRSLDKPIDWATAEALALGSLLIDGVPIRFAGEDVERGTFSQRHLVWSDTESGAKFSPLGNLGSFEIVNSPLTEFAGLGFEYGLSLETQGLTIWEAQYGDFFNGAEIIIDQYIVSGEEKWNYPSRLTLLLPHGYEGAGPEHSSARLERFLELCANNNICVANPTTPAQYFHLLRRQATAGKPLVIFTPKSLLRNPACVSTATDLIDGGFQEVIGESASRILFCSGKIYYDLVKEKKEGVAIVRLEQLYPLHLPKFEGKELIWVQEEPENMGAWRYMRGIIPNLRYVGRAESATTATGSNKKHKEEQAAIVKAAYG